jgi:hypothetical protein
MRIARSRNSGGYFVRSWLHLLKGRSLRKTRDGSIDRAQPFRLALWGVLEVHYGYSRQKTIVGTLSGRYSGQLSKKGLP